jgi:hypothetical protein
MICGFYPRNPFIYYKKGPSGSFQREQNANHTSSNEGRIKNKWFALDIKERGNGMTS